jgi:hypothetical protein
LITEMGKKAKKLGDQTIIKKYGQLLRFYGAQVMNEAKKELRNLVEREMSFSWIHSEAQSRAFRGEKVELKKRVFEQYMLNFKQELKEGEMAPLISRRKVLSIRLFL